MRIQQHFKKTLINTKGQVAIFVALVFQVLFLFFAMVINVGLLVHHKINLQNSVDMAAYYGAMKMAENMNAMAHVNYQIRQSWKLLAFRYRILGTSGESQLKENSGRQTHPFKKDPLPGAWLDGPPQDVVTIENNYLKNPPFCIFYVPFEPVPRQENSCRDLGSGDSFKMEPFPMPKPIATFGLLNASLQRTFGELKAKFVTGCYDIGIANYLTLGRFVSAFNMDQMAKMELLRGMALSMSGSEETFSDIDGEDVREGVLETLKNNLTAPNADSLVADDVFTYNSLASPTCAAKALGDWPKWLAPVKIFPGFMYVDSTQCDNGFSLTSKPLDQDHLPMALVNMPSKKEQYEEDILNIASTLGLSFSIFHKFNLSIGVEKNPWCMGYFGVRAKTSPKIPFSPFGAIELQAQAIAKPFGGRMGPWYGANWAPGSPTSSQAPKVDPLLPPRVTDQSNLSKPQDPTRLANYSRYVGDQYGLKSRMPLGYFGRGIFYQSPAWNPSYKGDKPSLNHWSHLPFYAEAGSGDILAWNNEKNSAPGMRYLELGGVLPDLFDIAYYSIEPDFFNNYYQRLKSGLAAKLGIQDLVRADIGYRGGAGEWSNFSIKNQYEVLSNETFKQLQTNVVEQMKYITTDWANTLTSWVSYGMGDYKLDEQRFGRCGAPVEEGDPHTPSNCKYNGGTTGYGVKLVSPNFLRRKDLPLGGESGARGGLENPPPEEL